MNDLEGYSGRSNYPTNDSEFKYYFCATLRLANSRTFASRNNLFNLHYRQ